MRKKVLSTLLALCMVVALLPNAALAATTITGGTITASSTQQQLEDIFGTGTVNMSGQDSEGNTATEITLTGDVDITGMIKFTGGNFVIQGGNINTDIEDVFKVESGAKLTLGEDLIVNSTNTIIYAYGGTINIEGATLTVTGENANPTAFAENGGTITLTSGRVSLEGRDMVTMNAGVNGTININGGSVYSGNSSAIVSTGGTVNIAGGEVSTADGAFCAVYAKKNGVVNVTGGTVSNPEDSTSAALIAENTGEGGGKVVVSENATINGDVLGHGSTSGKASGVEVTGGTVNGNVSVKTTAQADITGGNIAGDVKNHGSGDVTISDGATVGGDVTNNGIGDVKIENGATVSGSVTNSGEGGVEITGAGTTTGDVTNNGTGTGGVTIDGATTGNVTNSGTGAGGVEIKNGATTESVTNNSNTSSVAINDSTTGDVTNSGAGSTTIGGDTTVDGDVNGSGATITGGTVNGTVGGDVTLDSNTYSVTFDVDGGTAVPTQYVTNGNTVTKPADPTRPGTGGTFTFVGWYSDDAFTNEWDFDNDTVTQGLTLYAKWEFTYANTDATLSDLTISVGTLTPIFDADTLTYTANVENSVTSITVTPTTADPNATVTVNGVGANNAIPLELGVNTIIVAVTSEDGNTTKVYTIKVTREDPPSTPTVTMLTVTKEPETNVGGAKVTIQGTAGKFYTVDIEGTTYYFSVAADANGEASFIVGAGTTVEIYETSTPLEFDPSTKMPLGWTGGYAEVVVD